MEPKKEFDDVLLSCSKLGYIFHCFCISLLVWPLFILAFGLLLLVRQLVHTILRFTNHGRFHLMNSTDAACCVDYNRCRANYLLCFHVRNTINKENLEKLREKIRQRITTSPYKKLQLRLCTKFGFKCWEDFSEFDITDHIKLCPGVNSWENTISQTELMSLARNVLNSSLQPSGKPDWEILIVPRLRMKGVMDDTNPKIFATLILRLNHGYMDANCAFKFLQDCVFDEDGSSITTLNMLSKKTPVSFLRRIQLFLKVLLYGPAYIVGLYDKNRRRNIIHETCTGPSFIGRSKLNMSYLTLNKIRIAFGCETKSIITYAFLTAISRLAETSGFSMPKQLTVSYAHAMPPYNEEKLENRLSVVLRDVPTAGLAQLPEIDRRIRINESNTHEVTAVFMLGKVAGCLPLKLFRLLRRNVECPCTFTIVATREHRFMFQGGIVESGFGVPPLVDGSQYMASIGTYGGFLSVAFHIANTPLVKHQCDFQNFIKEFDNCLRNLEEQAYYKLCNHG